MKTALILGATGLTGNILLNLLLENEQYKTVVAYVRNPLSIQHPKLVQQVVNFDTINNGITADDVFCCLGTTIKKAQTKMAFEKVDYEYPFKIAQLQFKAGSQNFFLISAMGASLQSSFYYSTVKGKLEKDIQHIGYDSLYIFRPSLIVGDRSEKRAGEKFAIALMKFLNPVLVGPFKKFQSVKAKAIANAMLHFANNETSGTHIILSDEIKTFE
jgi:uncharacterized protein YbjT (DUF2867 family)